MSHEEDLIDYSDEEIQTTEAPANGAAAAAPEYKGDLTVTGGKAGQKGSYVGIHSTGFRDFLLKPELLRAITDCGFEHPSEGQSLSFTSITSVPQASVHLHTESKPSGARNSLHRGRHWWS